MTFIFADIPRASTKWSGLDLDLLTVRWLVHEEKKADRYHMYGVVNLTVSAH